MAPAVDQQFVAFLQWWHRDIHPFPGPVKPADVALCEQAERDNLDHVAHSGKE